ncbi:hypothetical protein [Aureibacillus halotolerans]|uniref:ABC-2 family transporter n=1 Tax=Aureibacillus halotolerans TaxID=1508390 RepID=A0A4R6U6L8_9BACI|nr:hypothetical protein [Aureibacillus halotolerans]TDQ40349.1 hypothetical protein EV213_10665 [Aureibacillus halotolerans]
MSDLKENERVGWNYTWYVAREEAKSFVSQKRQLSLMVVYSVLLTLLYLYGFKSVGFFAFDSLNPLLSQGLFVFITLIQIGLIALLMPVSLPRREKLINYLNTHQKTSKTSGRQWSVLLGSMMSSVGFMLLVGIVTAPLYGSIFLYGRVPFEMMGITAGILGSMMLVVSSVGLLCAVVTRKSIVAKILTCFISSVVAIGSLILAYIYLYTNELIGGDALFSDQSVIYMPLSNFVKLIDLMTGNVLLMTLLRDNVSAPLVPLWLLFVLLISLVICLSLLAASARLKSSCV